MKICTLLTVLAMGWWGFPTNSHSHKVQAFVVAPTISQYSCRRTLDSDNHHCLSTGPPCHVCMPQPHSKLFSADMLRSTRKAHLLLGLTKDSSTTNEPGKNDEESSSGGGALHTVKKSFDLVLVTYFALWYLGNYFYKITNKRALQAAGGAAGFPMTISSLQLGIGSCYGIFLWLTSIRKAPSGLTWKDIMRMLPLAFCYAGAHNSSSFAYSAGSVSFAEIVKAAEPAFAAILAQFLYLRPVSKAKWMTLPIIIGGVMLATVKELNFCTMALVSGCIANLFAAFRGNENKRIMNTGGLQDRIGSVGNQFALTSILSFVLSLPFLVALEGRRWREFVGLVKTSPTVKMNLIASALWFYVYNELSTMTLKKTGAVTQSVANTAKRVIVLVGSAIVFGESWTPLKAVGCAVGIGGVFLYSIVDQIFVPSK